MTNQKIAQELRRSALGDIDPWAEAEHFAFSFACRQRMLGSEVLSEMSVNNLRTFYLLVAEAINELN